MRINTTQLKNEIANKYNVNKVVVSSIVDYPFIFYKGCISDGQDTKSLRLKFGAFYMPAVKYKIDFVNNLISKLPTLDLPKLTSSIQAVTGATPEDVLDYYKELLTTDYAVAKRIYAKYIKSIFNSNIRNIT